MIKSRVLIIDNTTKSLPQVRRRLEDLGSNTDVVATSQAPSSVEGRYQAIVLTGTKVRAYETEHYAKAIDLVMTSNVPVYGICGGMQVIAVSQGAALIEGPQRVGSHTAHVEADEPLFAYVGPEVSLFHRHTLYLQDAPEGFRSIGRSDQAPVEFLCSDDGRIYGSQAHVEFRGDGHEILRGFTQIFA